ncbi:MAG: RNA methyltransferase [Deltaproteobacteria bacterium]|nr:RNA methyltransferase [Deltaproteobacteria bacterium]
MTTTARIQRMETVLAHRLGHIRCAAEAVYQRHNVSAILRTCDAFGVHHVHVVGEDFTATKGAARGAERWLAIHRHPTVEEAVAAIRLAGFRIWVADLAEDGVMPEDLPLDAPVCLWVGAELEGVSEAARAAADGVVTVPMRGFTQSLNVSVAAAVALRPLAERVRALGPASLLPESERAAILQAWRQREEVLRKGIDARASLRLEEPS